MKLLRWVVRPLCLIGQHYRAVYVGMVVVVSIP